MLLMFDYENIEEHTCDISIFSVLMVRCELAEYSEKIKVTRSFNMFKYMHRLSKFLNATPLKLSDTLLDFLGYAYQYHGYSYLLKNNKLLNYC